MRTEMTDVEILPAIDKDISEPDGMSHYVRIKALMQGGVVTALCGKRWVPNDIATAGEKPICPKCKDLFDLLRSLDG